MKKRFELFYFSKSPKETKTNVNKSTLFHGKTRRQRLQYYKYFQETPKCSRAYCDVNVDMNIKTKLMVELLKWYTTRNNSLLKLIKNQISENLLPNVSHHFSSEDSRKRFAK